MFSVIKLTPAHRYFVCHPLLVLGYALIRTPSALIFWGQSFSVLFISSFYLHFMPTNCTWSSPGRVYSHKWGGIDRPNLETVHAHARVCLHTCRFEHASVICECMCVACAVLLATPSVQDVKLFSSLKFFFKITQHIYRKPVPGYSLLPTLKQLICV